MDFSNITSEQFCWLGDTNVYLPDVKTEDPFVVSTYNNWIQQLVQEYGIDGLRIDGAWSASVKKCLISHLFDSCQVRKKPRNQRIQ